MRFIYTESQEYQEINFLERENVGMQPSCHVLDYILVTKKDEQRGLEHTLWAWTYLASDTVRVFCVHGYSPFPSHYL